MKIDQERIDSLRKAIELQEKYDRIYTTEFVYEGSRVYLKTVKRKDIKE